MALWKRTTFWQKVKDTTALFGTGGQIILTIADSSHIWNYVMGGATIIGMLVALWMDDKNADGIVDIFEDNEIKLK